MKLITAVSHDEKTAKKRVDKKRVGSIMFSGRWTFSTFRLVRQKCAINHGEHYIK